MQQRPDQIITRRPCAPRARCRNWRDCPTCAAIRQAKIADAAERLQAFDPDLTWTTLHPIRPGPDAAIAARKEWLRRVDPPAGLWTIEQSPSTGNLHVNIIAPTDLTPALIHSQAWSAPIVGDARNVAAYISKRSQFPRRPDYTGRLYGTCGPLWSFIASPAQLPAAAAAALQYELDAGRHRGGAPLTQVATTVAADLTRDDYREIARRHLPDILAARRPDPSKFNDR